MQSFNINVFMLFDYRHGSMRKGAHYGSDVHDEDVDNETQRVHSGSNDSTLVVKDLCKVRNVKCCYQL